VAYVAFLDAQPHVDKTKKIGTQGYCMGGPLVVKTCAAVPNRVGAGASFHGGGLVTPNPNSPHLQAAKTKAQFLIAIASNDDARSPNEKNVLKETFAQKRICPPKSKCTPTLRTAGAPRIRGFTTRHRPRKHGVACLSYTEKLWREDR
jgi:dienelactone hydrolase